MLVNSIKFDQSGAAGGSRSDTHRGVHTFEKLAFPKIKRHIGMKPIVTRKSTTLPKTKKAQITHEGEGSDSMKALPGCAI